MKMRKSRNRFEAAGPLLPQLRLPQRVRYELGLRRVVDESLGAIQPERCVPSEVLVQIMNVRKVGASQVDGEPRRYLACGP